MALSVSLTFSLVLVLSAGGNEIWSSPSTLHWLRSLNPAIECATAGIAKGTLVADQDNCRNAYMCDGSGGYNGPISCGNAMCFDPSNSKCITYPDPLCNCPTNECKTVCANIGDQLVDLTDCGKHYICLAADGSNNFAMYCDAIHPFFNGMECVTDRAECCTCQVTPECTVNDIGDVFPDPKDCHYYYACADLEAAATPAVQRVHARCNDGGSFVNGQCDPNTNECTSICDLGGGGSISTQPTVSDSYPTPITSTSSSATTTTSSATPTETRTTSSTTTATITGCLDESEFPCPSKGYYARCSYCDPRYFSCDGIANAPTLGYCPVKLVFNINPQDRRCVQPIDCFNL